MRNWLVEAYIRKQLRNFMREAKNLAKSSLLSLCALRSSTRLRSSVIDFVAIKFIKPQFVMVSEINI
jgi:hypothetical protein